MRGLIASVSVMALAVLTLAPPASAAEPRIGPPLRLSVDFKPDGAEVLVVAGRGCRPMDDAPASVLVTVEEQPGEVFTAKPDSSGHWSLELPIADPDDFSFTINAECDNYFGTTIYPQTGLGVAGTPTVITHPTHQDTPPVMAETGSRTGDEIAMGLAALVLGALLLWIGRRRDAYSE